MSLGIIGIFTAGLLTFVTPCVLPLVPIYLSALIGADIKQISGIEKGQLLFRAALFSIGFISVFTLMGLTASSIGGFMAENKVLLQGGGALLILVFGLKFLGVIRIPLFDRIVRGNDQKLQTRFGGLNALIMGVVFAAGWSPCVGPVLGSVLTYTASTTADPLTGAGYLTVYGFGFAIPLMLTAAFAEAGVRLLKRINPYLPRIERGIGALLLIVAASMLWDLSESLPGAGNETLAAEAGKVTDVASLTTGEDGYAWPAMVEFHSKSCTICQEMKPLVEGLTSQCHGNMVLVKTVDVSDPANRHYVKDFRLVGVPTFLFLDDEGMETARLVGRQTEDTLMQALSALRGKPCPGLGLLQEQTGEHSHVPIEMPRQDPGASVACETNETLSPQSKNSPKTDCEI